MCKKVNRTVQVSLQEFKKEFGEISWETSLSIAKVLKSYLKEDKNFTGKLVFTVNCRNGGIGNTSANVLTEI